MFTLELDLILAYIPPMGDEGGGIHLTRTLSLPFPPYNELRIFSRAIDHCPDPEGFSLQDVVWDIDREVFLAHAESISQGLPVAEIPADIRSWIDLGWRLGSYSDRYEETDAEEEGPHAPDGGEDDEEYTWDEMLRHPTLAPQQRPQNLNQVMRAMIRTMVESFNNLPTAYAMNKTKRHFTEQQLRNNDSKAAKQWREALAEYQRLDWRQQAEWRSKIVRTHPRLEKLVERV